MTQEQEMVYAIYPYQATRDDEIDFDYGEPIIIIERDDMYGDGWWKGQNIHGKIGLFPMNYTSSDSKYKLDNKVIPVATRFEPHKINGVDSKENNSIINDTIEDLRNKLQMMINNNNNNNDNNKRTSKKGLSRRSRLSSTTSSSSYFSARINSDKSSSRNSIYQQHSHVINNDDHTKSHKISSHFSTSFDDDNKNNIKRHPSTWNVYQVCQWLRENGFGSETKKFIENDVTGDVLLSLDLVALKEIDISSFGKRVHILNTIALLKDQYLINNDNLDKARYLTKSQLEDFNLSNIHADDAYSDSQHTLVSNHNNHINGRKTDLNPASYYNALPSPKEDSEKQKLSKKSSRIFLKFGPFGKSNKEGKAKKSEKSEKSERSRPSFSGGWDFSMGDDIRESISNERSKTKSPSVYDETISTSTLCESEKNSSLKFIPGRRKKISLDRKGVVGSQLGLPKELLDNKNSEKRESRVNSYYSEHIVDYINTNNEVLKNIGIPDHDGWLKKQGDKYRNWKNRFCILKGTTLYYLKSDKALQNSKIKGQINLTGYKIIPDENVYQGKYGFKLLHGTERPHFFVHEDLEILRGWMRAIMKTTIDIGETVTITSSDHIPTVSLQEARKVANRMYQPPPSNILPSSPTFSNLPPRPAPSPPNVLPSSPTFSNLPPRLSPSPPNTSIDNSVYPNIFPPSPKFSNLSPRPAPSPSNILIDDSILYDSLPPTPTFSNFPPRPAPSPPISEFKSTATISLSSLPKPKAPPTGALPPRPKPSNLNPNSNPHKVIKPPSLPPPLEHDHSSLHEVIKSPPPFEHEHSLSHKVIKLPSSQHEHSSPSLTSRTKYSKSQTPNSPTMMPKFPSMTLSLLKASRTPFNNKYNEISMGSYV
ncbi:hypothetical protein RclHR1_09100003 [Rhizophagus clarus]|uniref:Polar growth protein n=1 Tax=Rhizophagus clarus TaxID=94130 RepID=A0A2Z6SGV2_9GLOM|nr:hypothetical protein RclHR1_09100003 [Rhizophagus clarus]GES91780.1 polar growth protein [Rhizophagus clarus]